MSEYREVDARTLRSAIRDGLHRAPTMGLARGFAQANMIAIPREYLESFLLYAVRNPIPCPVIDVTDPGATEPTIAAPGADLSRDLGLYNIYRDGNLVETARRVDHLWDEDTVGILLGCSYTFERALSESGIPLRHVETGRIIPMYETNIPTRSAGPFEGPIVVTMRPIAPRHLTRATLVSSRFTMAHGGPIHVGDPIDIGIADIHSPDWGEPPTMHDGEVPVFWACGVTSQRALEAAALPLALAHVPAYMFVTDLLDEDLATGIPVR